MMLSVLFMLRIKLLIVLFSCSIVMSSAYVNISVLSLLGCGMSLVKSINNVGESAEPWGTPALDVKVLEKQFLCVIL